jgi:stalled ribosome alternative rescue factor ArfA
MYSLSQKTLENDIIFVIKSPKARCKVEHRKKTTGSASLKEELYLLKQRASL